MAIPHSSNALQPPLRMTEAEYLEFEAKSDIRHEFVHGRVLAMAGAEWNHNALTGSTHANLYIQLRGKPCTSIASDLRLKVDSKKVSYRYPDVMVICDEPNFVDGRTTIDNPTVVIEVLSPSTALEDRNAKLDEYTRLDSVQEYILISQDEVKVERYKRHESGEWRYLKVTGEDSELELPSIGCTLLLSVLYEDVEFRDIE